MSPSGATPCGRRGGGELGHTLQVRLIFDWTCGGKTLKGASSFPVESNPPRPLPKCQHTSCAVCLASAGGEGGWHKCRWSSALSQEGLVDQFLVDLSKHVGCPAMFMAAKQPIACVTHGVAGVVCVPQVPVEEASSCMEAQGTHKQFLCGPAPVFLHGHHFPESKPGAMTAAAEADASSLGLAEDSGKGSSTSEEDGAVPVVF
ncbi:hypothetical protein HPB52_013153 [Rhipicephalus sanguineus]|uniref:Uncharacterized protein n=1 Tax=Rhipicephalus sanguineus TaxID=34632 RepID=A0A9D4QDS1_RHISA|nr:hypothetical protein HPB52_013153 [Rhipicephalus sanguineus]